MNDLIEIILNKIEECEYPLLSWGINDVSHSKDELIDIIFPLIDKYNNTNNSKDTIYEFDEIFNNLIINNHLYEIPDKSQCFRTRMAETIRLISTLRQLFPKHNKLTDGKVLQL